MRKQICIFLAGLCIASSAFAAGRVTFSPTEADDIFANPGMGWQTFHRFADDDPNLEGIPSGSAYFRFYWSQLEPAEGRIDFALLDSLLVRAHKAGQKLALRVMCVGTGSRTVFVPQWLIDKGCPGFEFDKEGGKRWVPDMDHPIFLNAHLRLIRELGKRYDGHPDLDTFDIGSVGLWGEWHMSGTGVAMPSEKTILAVLDAYRESFPRVPKVMLIGGDYGMKYAVAHGWGWRADCLGDMGGFNKSWNHMENFYPQAVEKASAADAWKTAPIAFESCWTMQKWSDEGWCIPCIFDYGLKYHASYVNNKSSRIPAGSRPEIDTLLRRLGYRLVIRSAQFDAEAKAGTPLNISMRWENVGVAPPYFDYRIAFRLSDDKDGKPVTLPTDVSIKGWLPGARDAAASPAVPKGLKKGAYTLSIAVVDPRTNEPAVRLAIKGRGPDGWYPMGKIQVR